VYVHDGSQNIKESKGIKSAKKKVKKVKFKPEGRK
jgi:hypothetical protein